MALKSGVLLHTLGQFKLSGAPLTRPKPLMLLAYLALEGRQAREDLVEVFFGGEYNGPANLRTTLRRLRQAMPEQLSFAGDRVATSVSCDAKIFLDSVDAGDLGRGVAVYQGPFLQGVHLNSWTVELERWMYATRERLGDRQRQSLLALALAEARQAEFTAAAGFAVQAAAVNEASELELEQSRLLYLLVAAGNGTLPRQDSGEGALLTEPFAARQELLDSRWLRTRPYTFPIKSGMTFVGRDEERNILLRTLAMPEVRLVTLVGPGGIGKSRLAQEVALLFPQRDEVAFVTAEPSTTLLQLPRLLARALRAPETLDSDPVQAILHLLDRRSVLLILDSAELLEGGLGWLSTLLQQCPSVKVLVTTRERLTLAEAWTMYLGGLPLPPAQASSVQIRASGAAQLFIMRATRQRLGLHLGDEELQIIKRICEAVGGSPLGIELAASWVRAWSLAHIGEALSTSLDMLVDEDADVPRHHSVRAVFEQSWATLGPEQSAALVRLSVFSAGCTADAAQAVTGGDWARLLQLVDRSLVEVTADHRYRLHPLIRQFASERLHLNPVEEARATATRRAVLWQFAQDAGRALRDVQQEGTWVDRIFLEFDNLRQSMSEWLALGEPQPAAETLNALRPFWNRGPALNELHGWYERVLASSDALAVPLRADTYGCAGQVAMYLGHQVEATALLHTSLTLGEQQGNASPLTHLMLGTSYLRQDDLPTAQSHYQAAHEAFLAAGRWPGVASSLNNLGYVLQLRGNLHSARDTYEAALVAKRKAGGDVENVLINLASVYREIGDHDHARSLYIQTLEGSLRRRFLDHIPHALEGLAQLAFHRGRPVLAARLLATAAAQGGRTESVRPEQARQHRDRLIAHIQEAISADVFAQAWTDGEQWSPEEVLKTIMGE